jgi:hypothetical protein
MRYDLELMIRRGPALRRGANCLDHSEQRRLPETHDLLRSVREATMKLFDVVALSHDLPKHGLVQGQVGETAVEQLAPDVFEVEFADLTGRAYAMMALKADDVMILHHDRMLQPLNYRLAQHSLCDE